MLNTYYTLNKCIQWDIPGGPADLGLCFHYRGGSFDPGRGTKIPSSCNANMPLKMSLLICLSFRITGKNSIENQRGHEYIYLLNKHCYCFMLEPLWKGTHLRSIKSNQERTSKSQLLLFSGTHCLVLSIFQYIHD